MAETDDPKTGNGSLETSFTEAEQSDFFDELGEPDDRYSRGKPLDDIRVLTARLRKKLPDLNTEEIAAFAREAVSFFRNRIRIKPREALVEYDRYLGKYIGNLLMEGFKTGKMPLPVFYVFTEKWAEVCNSKDYPLQEKAVGILKQDTKDMLEIVTPPESDTLRIYDFGVGSPNESGLTKGEIIVQEAIEQNERDIEYHGVDASEEMLRMALGGMATKFLKEALGLKEAKRKERNKSKWSSLIQFLRRNNREFSRNPEYLPRAFKNIFGKHYDNPGGIDLLRFLIARMVSLHKTNDKEFKMMQELDNKVNLPLKIFAHPEWFQDLDPVEFEPNETDGVVIFDLGSEMCNQFPGKSIKMFHDLLSDPKTPKHPDGIVPLEEEKETQAAYTVLGLQLGEVPTSQTQFRKLRTKMREAYNNPAFRALTTHPFLRKDIKYIGENNEELAFEDIGFIYVDYEEDPDNPGYYGATHRLYITENIKVINGAGEEIHIPGKERVQEVFKNVVDALFDPDKEETVGGRRNEILRSFNISTKEELLKIDPKQFFSRDYSNYRSGMHIAEDILEGPNNFEQTLLYPSYKPSLEQIVDLCHQNGLKVIKVYGDGETDSSHTYVKILTRKMTEAEKGFYKNGDYDASIFYIPETAMILDDENTKERRNARKARHKGSKLKKQPLPSTKTKTARKRGATRRFKDIKEKRKNRTIS